MARFYSNENFPRRVVESLRSLGHDVLTSLEAGRANQRIPDEAVLQFATSEGRAVLTLNRRDFVHLHTEQPEHAWIIVCTYDADAPAFAARIHQTVSGLSELHGLLLRVSKPR
jgi:Domain of unknown function (DUF5615)